MTYIITISIISIIWGINLWYIKTVDGDDLIFLRIAVAGGCVVLEAIILLFVIGAIFWLYRQIITQDEDFINSMILIGSIVICSGLAYSVSKVLEKLEGYGKK